MKNKDRCSFCKGKLYEGKTEFVAKVGDGMISIKDVPAYVCENCGEAYFMPEISRKIDEVMMDFHGHKLLAHPIAAGEVAATFQAAIEDDPEEDAIWRKYIK